MNNVISPDEAGDQDSKMSQRSTLTDEKNRTLVPISRIEQLRSTELQNLHRYPSFESLDTAMSVSTSSSRSAHVVHDSRRRTLLHDNRDRDSTTSSMLRNDMLDDTTSSLLSSSNTSSVYSPVTNAERASMLPREGFFWRIRLYLKLSRGLPSTNSKGKIDPYVKVKYRGKTLRRTVTVFGNRSPVWDETFYVAINNLEYPMELRVYNRDAFKKDDYIGRVLVPLKNLSIGIQQEFTMRLEDETGRSVEQNLGEVNFFMTLNETPEGSVSSDRRQSLLKQLKTDRQTTQSFHTRSPLHHLVTPSASNHVSEPTGILINFFSTRRAGIAAWCESMSSLTRGVAHEVISNMFSEEPVEQMMEDEWVHASNISFHQPRWPPCFFDGTKIELYTNNLENRTKPMSINQLSQLAIRRTDVRLDQMYTRARLVVWLLRGENLGEYVEGQPSSSPTQKVKILHGRGMEKAVLGRPLSKADTEPPSPVAHLCVGKTVHHSMVIHQTRDPLWHQGFEFRVRLGEKTILKVEVFDASTALEPILAQAYLDFTKLLPDWTNCFTLKNSLEGRSGRIVLLATLTGFSRPPDLFSVGSSNSTHRSPTEDHTVPEPTDEVVLLPSPQGRVSAELLSEVVSHFGLMRTLESRSDVGWLYIHIQQARELTSKDRNGKLDPYCALRLVNRCAYTSTVYKTNNPTWNQSFVFPIGDLYDVLHITVLQEDKEDSEFLGRIALPLIHISNRKGRWYALKDKHLIRRRKGALYIETYIVCNQIRAAIRAAYPREKVLVWSSSRVKLRNLLWKYVPKLQQKIDRITPYANSLTKSTQILRSLYLWENHLYSTVFLTSVCFAVLFVQPYMLFSGLVLGLICSQVPNVIHMRPNSQVPRSPTVQPYTDSEDNEVEQTVLEPEENLDDYSDSDSDDQETKLKKDKKKPLKIKLRKAREVMGTLLDVMEGIASAVEKFDSIFRWQVPCLSGLVLLFLIFLTVLTFFVPMRLIIVIYVLKKFTRNLRNPGPGDASPLSFVLRVPDKVEKIQYRLLRPYVGNTLHSRT
ncbi:unnamed protein product [Dicrocoelium dendriticum]|nr:unnamed protein product [Dicrocoelium dendriticum]